MWPQTASVGASLDRLEDRCHCPGGRPARVSQWPLGGEWTTSTASSGHPASPPSRLLLVEVEAPVPGSDRDAAPRPKNCEPSISVPCPWSTVAAPQLSQAPRRASSVSLLPGTRTVGADRPERVDRLPRPSWTEAKSPAAITTSASEERSTRRGLVEVAMQVAEREQPHGPQSATVVGAMSFGAPSRGQDRGHRRPHGAARLRRGLIRAVPAPAWSPRPVRRRERSPGSAARVGGDRRPPRRSSARSAHRRC